MECRRLPHRTFWTLAVLAPFVLCGTSCRSMHTQTPADSPDTKVETAPNATFISMSGKVVETSPERFVLDYGPSTITVEMENWSWFPQSHNLLINDNVVVYGYIDDDLFERRTVEASSVYVSSLGTQFYANGVDEEDFPVTAAVDLRPRVEMTGKVTQVNGDEFKLDTGAMTIDVDTDPMGYDPLDEEGFQQIRPGDRVRVSGKLGKELFESRELMAEGVVSLQ